MLEREAKRPKGVITQEHDDIIALLGSPGWSIILESLGRNKELAVAQLCTDKPMSEVDLAYQRATIQAIDRMMKHPRLILDQLRTELLMNTEGKPDGTE